MGKNKRWIRKAKRIHGHCITLNQRTNILDCACLKCKYNRHILGCKFNQFTGSEDLYRLRALIKNNRYMF